MFAPGTALNVKGQGIPYTVYGQVRSLQQKEGQRPRQRQRPISHHEEQLNNSLASPMINIGLNTTEGLRSLCWSGVPRTKRAEVWRLLCEYLPSSSSRREREHIRKVNEYSDFVTRYFDTKSLCVPQEKAIIHQIGLDLPRHKQALYHIPALVKPLERVLYIWSLRHPVVGYVQGMDDIVACFYMVFLADQLERCGVEGDCYELVSSGISGKALLSSVLWTNGGPLTEGALRQVEADTYWCGGKVLAWTQDNFVHGLKGVHSMVIRLQDLLDKVDSPLSIHFHNHCIELQFTFQWMHCLLTRELPFHLAVRLWDTYLAIGQSFYEFHVYICCALLTELSKELRGMEPEDILVAVKRPCPEGAKAAWLEGIIATAYMQRLQHPPDSVWKGVHYSAL